MVYERKYNFTYLSPINYFSLYEQEVLKIFYLRLCAVLSSGHKSIEILYVDDKVRKVLTKLLSGKFTPFGAGASQAFQQHDPRRLIENKLLRLLTEYAWNSIKLNEVVTSYNGENLLLSRHFIANLSFDLNEHHKTLSELSIKNAAFNPLAWINFLRNQSLLEILGFEINIVIDESLKELCSVLEKDSQLIELDLGDTDISLLGYQSLNELLDKNYKIKKITLKEPKNPGLKVLYQELNQRLAKEKTSKERFVSEQLNLQKIVNLIFDALKKGNRDLFYFLMNESAQNTITDVERSSISKKMETWVQN
ncbi:MAG: hypothetical protein WAL30_07345 [Candidatus Aquirickettsiella sp.]